MGNSGLRQAVGKPGAVELILVRHGESGGNVAATKASRAGADVIDVPAREFGIPDMLTAQGVERRLPGEADRRCWLGKFYYRPPGGKSCVEVTEHTGDASVHPR